MVESNLSTIISAGLNDPNCSFYVGQMFGQFTTYRIVFGFFILYFVFEIIRKLAFEPSLEWVKNKIYKKKDVKNGRSASQ